MYYVYTAVILRTISVRSRGVCSTVVYGESTVLDNSSYGQIDMAAFLHRSEWPQFSFFKISQEPGGIFFITLL